MSDVTGVTVRTDDSREAYAWRAALGIAAYLALVFAPVTLMLLSPPAADRELLREVAVALGFVAAGILFLQFALSARLRRLKAPYGLDVVYHFHRRMAVIALALVVVHAAVLVILDPEPLELLNVLVAPRSVQLGSAALLVLAGSVIVAGYRPAFRLRYEWWHALHGPFAVGILVLAVLHTLGVDHYVHDWKRVAWVVYPALFGSLLLWVRVGRPLFRLRRPYRVTGVRRETPDVWTLSFEPEGHEGMRFRPGQFAWVTIGRSPFSLLEHPFSISSEPRDDGSLDMTVKELGDFTSTIGETEPGTTAYLDGPFGAFTMGRHPSDSYVYLVGGIGITPVMSHLRAAARRGEQARLILLYGAQTLEDVAFREEIESLKDRLDLSVTLVLEQPPRDWEGERGFITTEVIERAVGDPDGHEYYMCGPPAMVDAVSGALEQVGVSRKRVHYERFALA